jgi:hypothetical protein
MVFVLMGKKYSIQLRNSLPKHLLTEVGAGIYYETLPVYFHVNRNPETLIPEIKGAAGLAGAADHGNALRSARS